MRKETKKDVLLGVAGIDTLHCVNVTLPVVEAQYTLSACAAHRDTQRLVGNEFLEGQGGRMAVFYRNDETRLAVSDDLFEAIGSGSDYRALTGHCLDGDNAETLPA